MTSRFTPLLTACAASALLAACAVGPKAPDAPLPPSASGAFVSSSLGIANGATSSAEARSDWWRLYADPTLDGLVEQAFAENNQLEAAVANLRAVRASLSESRSGRLPTTSLTAQQQRAQVSSATVPGTPPGTTLPESETYDAGLSVNYEVDLFGRVESTIRAARADVRAAEEALATLQVTVAAETARAYADVCSANAQLAVADRTLGLQQNTARLTQTLLEGGVGTGLNVASARAAVAQTAASLPTLRAAKNEALFRLSTLTGRTPAQSDQAVAACVRPPQLTQPVPVVGTITSTLRSNA